ncbi:MAG: lipoate--protein ligase family protein [Anaerolineales bacterium]|nr:lipoate--protein ligase family protein [Anaerolineales bacterium]
MTTLPPTQNQTPLPAQWRLLRHPAARGAHNMAVDAAILEMVVEGKSPPTLRFYDWEPACLSLGFAQHYADIDLAAQAARGWDVVRRPTGGRAILHTDELTYSVIGASDEPRLAGGVLESYKRLSEGLMAALKLLGLPVERQPMHEGPGLGDADNPVCFEVPSDYEITLHGKKIIGSAQARRKGGVLQHGSLPLFGDIGRITEILTYPSTERQQQSAERVRARAATVEEGLGRRVSFDTAAEAFIQAFAETLNIEFIEGELSADEHAATERWLAERYANPAWTERA